MHCDHSMVHTLHRRASIAAPCAGPGSPCQPWGSPEAAITFPSIVVAALYVAFSLTTTYLSFQVLSVCLSVCLSPPLPPISIFPPLSVSLRPAPPFIVLSLPLSAPASPAFALSLSLSPLQPLSLSQSLSRHLPHPALSPASPVVAFASPGRCCEEAPTPAPRALCRPSADC
jgi:hypothetical protein